MKIKDKFPTDYFLIKQNLPSPQPSWSWPTSRYRTRGDDVKLE